MKTQVQKMGRNRAQVMKRHPKKYVVYCVLHWNIWWIRFDSIIGMHIYRLTVGQEKEEKERF